MTAEQIIFEAIPLPIAERVSIAQALWESIDAEMANITPCDFVQEAARRDNELSIGDVRARTHDEVMKDARAKLKL